MGLSIHTNFASMVAQNSLNKSNGLLQNAMERLGTGLRINSSADDAAGLQIANRLTAQTRGMAVAQRNAQDAISMLQTADGALDEISSIAFRMKDLATQAANGTNNDDDLAALDAEFGELRSEIERIMTQTRYGGQLLFEDLTVGADTEEAKFSDTDGVIFQIGAGSGETLELKVSTEIAAITTARGAALEDGIGAGEDAGAIMDAVDLLLEAVGTARAKFGANINRLEHTINNLASISQNVQAATGRIMDADFAVESSNMTKQQMLMQSGISILGNANQMTGLVASLLR